MWDQYKTVNMLVQQLFMFALCGALLFYGLQWPTVLALLICMEIGAFAGVWMGNRIKRRADEKHRDAGKP